jgi:hypothetical protein
MTNNTPSLLDAKEQLDRCLVEHTRFDEAKTKILRHLRFPSDKKILWVIGPSGVGKTRLAAKIASMICNDPVLKARADGDPGCIPSLQFEVPCISSNGRFAWSSFYHTYFDQLQCPLQPTAQRLPMLPTFRHKITPEDMVLQALKHRRPIVTLLDEANHFANVASGKALVEQMTRIKSFVNRSGVLHICFGTYETVSMTKLSEQLARRSDVIHFGRYLATSGDLAAFDKVVGNFQRAIRVAHHFDLRPHLKYLHERTIGCVGSLKTWMVDALGKADEAGRKGIRLEDLEATAPDFRTLEVMLRKAMEGEDMLRASTESEKERYRYFLGHSDKAPSVQGVQAELWVEPEAVATAATSGGKTKPFRQSPRRYPVGTGRNDQQTELAS